MSTQPQQPATELQLAKADEGERRIWVYEDHDEVLNLVAEAEDNGNRLVTFSRVQGIGRPGKQFSTRPSNIVNVRDIRD